MSAGRAVVSTPYAYARECLADGRGRLVEPASSAALAEALGGLLGDPELRRLYGRRAHEHTRPMVWPAIRAEYGRIFARAARRSRRPDGLAQDYAATRG
jgi:glycosyltransferase involved in cell wall biosynthesis